MSVGDSAQPHLTTSYPYGLQEPPTPARSKKAKNADHSLTEHTRPKPRKTLDELRREQAVSSFSSVSGIGYAYLLSHTHVFHFFVRSSRANALYAAGCRSLQDLREPEFSRMLSRPQQINAQYLIGLDRRMTLEQASTVRVCIILFFPVGRSICPSQQDFVTQNISSKYTVLLSGDL